MTPPGVTFWPESAMRTGHMQDMGYKLDRRNYYGFSVYRDGAVITNTQGYSARDAAGENYLPGVCNTTSLGIGLHVLTFR